MPPGGAGVRRGRAACRGSREGRPVVVVRTGSEVQSLAVFRRVKFIQGWVLFCDTAQAWRCGGWKCPSEVLISPWDPSQTYTHLAG